MKTYITPCVHCRQKLRVPLRVYGLRIICPKCRSRWVANPYKIIDIPQGSTAWHDWRNQGIGASDAPTIMGENPWKRKDDLINEKLNGPNFNRNSAMARGIELEPEARNCYERVTGLKFRPACLQSLQFDWLRASVDGLASDGSQVVEIKCGDSVYRQVASERRVPRYYYGQLQHTLAVTGLSKIDFWCYLPERPEIRLCIDRDDHYIDRLIKKEMQFWQEILRRRR